MVGEDNAVLGEAKTETPTKGGPPAVVAKIDGAVREAAGAAEIAVSELRGAGVGSPGAVDQDAGTVAHARNLPDWDEPFPLAEALGRPSARPCGSRTTSRSPSPPSSSSARASPRVLLGSGWEPGSAGPRPRPAALARRGAAGEIGHMVIKRHGARCPAGDAAAWRPTRGAAPWRRTRGSWSSAGRRPSCRSDEKRQARPADERRRADALERGEGWRRRSSIVQLARSGGIGSAVNLPIEAVIVGAGWNAPGRALRRADRGGRRPHPSSMTPAQDAPAALGDLAVRSAPRSWSRDPRPGRTRSVRGPRARRPARRPSSRPLPSAEGPRRRCSRTQVKRRSWAGLDLEDRVRDREAAAGELLELGLVVHVAFDAYSTRSWKASTIGLRTPRTRARGRARRGSLDQSREDVAIAASGADRRVDLARVAGEQLPQAQLPPYDGAAVPRDDVRANLGQPALRLVRKAVVELLGDGEAEDAVAEKLQPLVRVGPATRPGRVREGVVKALGRERLDQVEQ